MQLHDKAVIEQVNQKITDLRHRKVMESLQDDPEDLEQFTKGRKTEFMLRPLVDIHLHSYGGYNRSMGFILYVYIVAIIALFVLLIACINFMNLATARSANRAKEVGLRKVVGAMKSHLVGQFYGESILLAFIGLLLSIILLAIIIPRFNSFAEKEYSIKMIFQWKFLLGMMGVMLLTGIISGSYPALFLSAFQPVKVLRGALSAGVKGSLFRKVLVVFQFTLSIILILGTLTIVKQVNYFRNRELGYDKNNVIFFSIGSRFRADAESIKA